MLDLGMTKESDGGFVSLSPEVGVGKRKRIVESYDGVKVLGQRFKVCLGFGKEGGGFSNIGWCECGGTGGNGGEDSGRKFHFV